MKPEATARPTVLLVHGARHQASVWPRQDFYSDLDELEDILRTSASSTRPVQPAQR